MDWDRAIDRNREALRRILAALCAMAGLGGARPERSASPHSGFPDCRPPTAECRPTLPRHLHRAVLRLLRPAEAAARRLVIIAARDLALPPPALKPTRSVSARAGGRATLPLFDPLPRFRAGRARCAPRISVPGHTVSAIPRGSPITPFDAIDATRLGLRLDALAAVLDDLPAHARRLARWRARQAAMPEQGPRLAAPARRGKRGFGRRLGRVSPLRPCHPPGSIRRPSHPVHTVLDEIHGLAVWAMQPADTS